MRWISWPHMGWAANGVKKGIPTRHAAMNEIIHHSLASAKIPSSSCLAPSGPSRSNGRRPDGMSMVPWTSRKLLVWDATCSDTYAPSNINDGIAVTGAGAVAQKSAAAQDFQIFTSGLNLHTCLFPWQLRFLAFLALNPLSSRVMSQNGHRLFCVVLYHWVTMSVWWMFVVLFDSNWLLM